MFRRSALRLAAIAAAAAVTPVLAGCAAGGNAQTTQQFTPTDGASATLRGIAIRNVFVLGAGSGASLQPGESASLFMALVNDGAPDRLIAVAAPGTSQRVTIEGQVVNLGSGQAVLLTGPQPQLVLDRLQRTLNGGTSIPVTLLFQNAGAVTLNVPVVPRDDYYATFFPPPPSPSARTKTSPRPARSAGTVSPRPATPSPSAAATP